MSMPWAQFQKIRLKDTQRRSGSCESPRFRAARCRPSPLQAHVDLDSLHGSGEHFVGGAGFVLAAPPQDSRKQMRSVQR